MHDDDGTVGRVLTRREVVALFGMSGVAAIVHPLAGQQPASSIPACVVQPQQTEGPYFVDEKLNRSDVRSEPGTGAMRPGAPLELGFTVSRLAADGTCAALAGAQVDVWQCDALGVYSDVRDRSFDTVGQKFLRGHQVTDAQGSARFVTIYPGWYPGRAVHIHFKVRTNAPAEEFTSQLYFDEAMTDRIHAREPYASHTGQRTRNAQDRIFQSGGAQLVLPVTERNGRLAGVFSMAMRPGEPSPGGRGKNDARS